MKAYLWVSGVLFALVACAHVVRVFVEPDHASDPRFYVHNLGLSLIAAALAVWGLVLGSRPRGP